MRRMNVLTGTLVCLSILSGAWTTAEAAKPAEASGKWVDSPATVSGTLFLTETTCIGASDRFDITLSATPAPKESTSRRLRIDDPARGLVYTGFGGTRGFAMSKKRFVPATQAFITYVLAAGPRLADSTANFRYSATFRHRYSNATCKTVFEGNLRVL